MFHGASAFKRTLCGGKWSLAFTSATGIRGRYGCCHAGTFMTSPESNPFDKATYCSACKGGTYSSISARLECPYTATTCPMGSYASGTTSCTFCGTGKYGDQIGQSSESSCKVCGTGTYNIQVGQSSCQVCGGHFKPANTAALKAAVTSCLDETADGSCPTFAASNDMAGNPYGNIGCWDTSEVTSMSYSKL